MDLLGHLDLSRQRITAASLSDILRLLLLHEYGGVWVDATTFCNTPLDEWLDQAAQTGFFAFARPGEDRELSSWFLAAHPGNRLLAKWAARVVAYWRDREYTRDYVWMHHEFGELIAVDSEAFEDWQAVPRVSADGPHSVQFAGLDSDLDAVRDQVDWSAPLFKLTYRYEHDRQGPESLLTRLLSLTGERPPPVTAPSSRASMPTVAHLRVRTQNLGDHIQIIAAERLLARAGISPSLSVDRDNEIADPPPNHVGGKVGILLNGWFKTNPAQWPPNPAYLPIYLGFHIRHFQSPSLTGPEAIQHYLAHGPVGCRDAYTLSLLRARGVDAFLSHCLTLTYPRRLLDPATQTEVFVVSRDRKLLDFLPDDLGPFTFVSQYSDNSDFAANMAAAQSLLETYRTRAGLIVTSMLHCALPAIAMGIPVVVIYPPNEEPARTSDRERFSSLSALVRVYDSSEASQIDWTGRCLDVSDIKLRLIDRIFEQIAKWGPVNGPLIDGIAESMTPPILEHDGDYSYFNDTARLQRLAIAGAPDRQKWGAASSYRPEWATRSELAARYVGDGERVFEIGTGTGAFRASVSHRCHYVGSDLQPVVSDILTLNLEKDALPDGPWDVIAMLGVLEYIHDADSALAKIFAAASKLILSYCCPRSGDIMGARQERGWVNALDEDDLIAAASKAGLGLSHMEPLNNSEDFDQKIFVFERSR